MDLQSCYRPKRMNDVEERIVWKRKDLKNQHITKAREIESIQEEQVYLKKLEFEENRKTAIQRGAAATKQPQLKWMREEQPVRAAEEIRLLNSLNEKERARRIAGRPPPPQPVPLQDTQRETAGFYDTRFMGTWTKSSDDFHSTKSSSQGNAVLDAVLQREEEEIKSRQLAHDNEKRNETVWNRYKKAREKEQITQAYGSVLESLEAAHREDISRKQRTLAVKFVNKHNPVKTDHGLGNLDKQKKLEKEVQNLFFPIEATSDRSKFLLDQVRQERQNCMRKWRPESVETDGGCFGKDRFDEPVDQYSPNELNKAMYEKLDDSKFFSTPEDIASECADRIQSQYATGEHQHIPSSKVLLNKSSQIVSPNSDEKKCRKEESDIKILDPSNFQLGSFVKIPDSMDQQLVEGGNITRKDLVDISTQTCDSSLSSSQEDDRTMSRIRKLEDSEWGNLGSGDLKLGSIVSVPVVSDHVSPYISKLIKKAASKMFSADLDTGVVVEKLSSDARIKVKPNAFEDKENLTPIRPAKMTALPKFFSTDITITKASKQDENVLKDSVKLPDKAVQMKRKITKVTSAPISKDTEERLIGSEAKIVPKTPRKYFTSVDTDSIDPVSQENERTVGDRVLLPLKSKFNIEFKKSPLKIVKNKNSISTSSESVSTHSNKSKDKQDVVENKKTVRERVLSPLESKFNIDFKKSPRKIVKNSVSPSSESVSTQSDKSKDKQHVVESKEKDNYINSVHESSHASYFSKPRLFTIPSPNDKVEQNTKLQERLQSPLASSENEVVVQADASKNSVEQISDTSKEDSSELSLPNYLRHSLESKLKENNKSVTTNNIRQLLEQFAAFEGIDDYIRPPPPVSFPVGIEGTENVIPHELSTIVEVDTPHTSLVKSASKSHFEDHTTNSLSSVQISESESGESKPVASGSAHKVQIALSPSVSIPSSLSTWSSILKMYSPSISSSSSHLTDAFSAERIKTHSTPIKKRPEESATHSNLLDQSLTLVDGFSLDSRLEFTVDSTLTSPAKQSEAQMRETKKAIAYFETEKFKQLEDQELKKPANDECPPDLNHPVESKTSSSVTTFSSLASPSRETSTIMTSESDSMLSFLAHENSAEKYFNLSNIHF